MGIRRVPKRRALARLLAVYFKVGLGCEGATCVEIKILRRVRIVASSSTPSTRRLLDGVTMPIPRRSMGQHGRVVVAENAPDSLFDLRPGRSWTFGRGGTANIIKRRGRGYSSGSRICCLNPVL